MDIEEHEKLLSLYKLAIDMKLGPAEHATELRNARMKHDRHFSKNGKEYLEALRYIEELELLAKHIKDEQS